MADTQVYYETLLVSIDAQITALVANPQVDYEVGNVRVDASQKLDQLLKLREHVIKRMAEKPYEAIEVIQSDFSAFGENLGSFVDEDPQ
jgi:hypothetical protein